MITVKMNHEYLKTERNKNHKIAVKQCNLWFYHQLINLLYLEYGVKTQKN